MWQLVRPYMLPITDELTFTITVSGDWFCLIASSFAFPIPSIGMMSKLWPMIWLTWTRNKSLEGEGTETYKKKITVYLFNVRILDRNSFMLVLAPVIFLLTVPRCSLFCGSFLLFVFMFVFVILSCLFLAAL